MVFHVHVEHTQWGNIKVATRGAVCGCGCGCVWGVVKTLREVQCGQYVGGSAIVAARSGGGTSM